MGKVEIQTYIDKKTGWEMATDIYGREYRILCKDREGHGLPIVGVMLANNHVCLWSEQGVAASGSPGDDLCVREVTAARSDQSRTPIKSVLDASGVHCALMRGTDRLAREYVEVVNGRARQFWAYEARCNGDNRIHIVRVSTADLEREAAPE